MNIYEHDEYLWALMSIYEYWWVFISIDDSFCIRNYTIIGSCEYGDFAAVTPVERFYPVIYGIFIRCISN